MRPRHQPKANKVVRQAIRASVEFGIGQADLRRHFSAVAAGVRATWFSKSSGIVSFGIGSPRRSKPRRTRLRLAGLRIESRCRGTWEANHRPAKSSEVGTKTADRFGREEIRY